MKSIPLNSKNLTMLSPNNSICDWEEQLTEPVHASAETSHLQILHYSNEQYRKQL